MEERQKVFEVRVRIIKEPESSNMTMRDEMDRLFTQAGYKLVGLGPTVRLVKTFQR